MSTNQIAATILHQLGGSQFAVRTGAHSFSPDHRCLIFKLREGSAKDGIKAVRVTLNASDTYTMTFFRQAGAPTFTVSVVAEHSDVYEDQLVSIFTSTTGLPA